MNLHPIFVHFPIALLSVYSLMELVRFKKVLNQAYWFYTKALLVMIGGIGALASYFTGNFAKDAIRNGDFYSALNNYQQVVSLHEMFAKLSVAIFGIIAASYLISWVSKTNLGNILNNSVISSIWKIFIKLSNFFIQTRIVILMALLGLIAITITGGLGGMIVYGPNADPFFGMIYTLFFGSV